jgi:hypothetical protein
MSIKTSRIIPDPTDTNPDKYKVILENDQVRVFDYKDEPGDKTKMHHRKFVLYALTPFKQRLTFEDGTSVEREFTGEKFFGIMNNHI